MFDFLREDSAVVDEVMDEYSSLRLRGFGREQAVKSIFEGFRNELNDADDRPYVLIGVALVLCRKKELTQQTREDALLSINELKAHLPERGAAAMRRRYDKLTQYLSEERMGPEASYKMRKKYDPGWEIGDTFIHPFSHPNAEKTGLSGWSIVFRKVGEYQNTTLDHVQLAYVTICPPDASPQTDEELRTLGWLRMMEHDNGWDYLCQFSFKNKKDEERWQLRKIGCFPNAGNPDDAMEENPFVTYPLFGVLHRGSNELDYEDEICWLIRTCGIKK